MPKTIDRMKVLPRQLSLPMVEHLGREYSKQGL